MHNVENKSIAAEEQSHTRYTCPMHPEVQQDAPGTCPKCGMQLVPAGGPESDGAKADHEEMHGDHHEMVREMRAKWLWTNFTIIALGAWLVTSPTTFSIVPDLAAIPQREVPTLAFRIAAMTWSDILSGTLLIVFGTLSLWPTARNDFWGRWMVCLVGIWLQFAPLVFWAPHPAAYINDTLVGAFVIGLSVLVPMMPGMAHHMVMMKPGPEVPPGWTYNPSSWHQRAPMIALGFIGWFISRYLAAVQFGYIQNAWEPFFGEGTSRVLHSDMSRSWPVSDAGLGAIAYTLETLMGLMGAKTRWRTMPWMVTFFGILVIPLGLTHIVLVIMQPIAVGHWCTLCLAAAGIMLLMIPLAVDEVVVMCQFLVRAVRRGESFWWTFFVGGTCEEDNKDTRTPKYGAPALSMLPASVWGVSFPWTLLVSAALGLWLMFAPAVFQTQGKAAHSDHLVGPLAMVVAICVTAEVIRAGRLLNIPLGLWLIAAPWMLEGFTTVAQWNDVAVGLALIALAIPRGTIREHYGGWDAYIR